MEDNVHNDNKLDDYVRQSFDGYEEDPATDMWGRIEGDLSPREEPALRIAFYPYRWQAAAAAVIFLLLSTLVCGHLYYEQRLRALSAHASEMPVFSAEKPSEGAVFREKSEAKQAQPAAAQAASEAGGEKRDMRSAKPKGAEGSGAAGEFSFRNMGAQQGSAGQSTGSIAPQNTDDQHLNEIRGMVSSTSQQVAQVGSAGQNDHLKMPVADGKPLSEGGSTAVPPAAGDSAMSGSAAAPENQKQTDLQRIAPRSVLLMPLVASAAVPEFLPIKPARSSSGWYLGAHTTWLATQEKAQTTVTRPGGRPVFTSTPEASGVSNIVWLKVGKNWSSRFTLESGVGYQKTEQSAMHTPRFRFGDGTHVGGTPRTYRYDLSTYGGTAEVTLRMEQTNPSTQPTNEEPVALNITTTERSEALRIPVVAGYRLGAGRWRGSLKAGLLGSFVLKNELDISARVSQNARFRPVAGRQGYAVQVGDPEKFYLGYLLSAGAEFRCSRHVSLVAESLFTGDFARKDLQGQQLPQHFSVGLNVGANWYF